MHGRITRAQCLSLAWANRFLEVGAGAVLTGLLRSIAPAVSGMKLGEAADMESLAPLLASAAKGRPGGPLHPIFG